MKKVQHVLIVSIDTLRTDCINASPRARDYSRKYNTKLTPKTELLDQIINSGLYFNNCFSAAPYTSASHGAYFTGMWPRHNGVYEFFNRKLTKPTIFKFAKKEGYKTIFQTDFPVILGKYLGFAEGIDNFFIEDESKAFKKLVENKDSKTMSFFHFGGVHYPYGFHTLKFGGKDYVKKVQRLEEKYHISNIKNKPQDVLDETFRSKKDSSLLLRYKYIIEKLYQSKNYDALFDLYIEGINYFMKNRFDSFVSKLKTFTDDNDALLFIFSDHGEEWSSESEGHHNSLSDDVLRVPFVVYGKDIAPGVEQGLIKTIDFAPTVLKLLYGSQKSIKMDGQVIDIFRQRKKRSKPNYAISQIWTSIATKKQISQYQNSTIKNRTKKPLKSYLSGEVARTEACKLEIIYDKKGTMVNSRYVVYKKGSKNNRNYMSKILTDYNSSKIKSGKKIDNLQKGIREELNKLGYKV